MYRPDINSSKIQLTIRNTTDSIVAEWNNPQPRTGDLCYSSNVQFRSLTDGKWEGLEVPGFSYTLPSPNWRKSYAFRVRMKYSCSPIGPWSQWTLEKWWNSTSPPSEARHMDTNHGILTSLILIPFIAFLLFCLFSEKWIKRKCISQVPDPKNIVSRLLTIDESQLWNSLENRYMDCMTADIEIVPSKGEDGGDPRGAVCTEGSTLVPTVVSSESSCSPRDCGHSPVHSAYVYL
ncbi:cytokine receptor-like factor 2 [Brienomyrus brachyistius]|uniref:cytokine receptor-like factor 2 n=1 Tax=Brienomyrus brachyistius TaxID=42636 RepID=UPI0020B3A3CA|nr:cytokine receptor-like factor 2 [Brienomyrus brachyistius]XP_048871902.1 cytokine receptor-like factor 2 [Brienomyrus brachyistius]XP_048871903.1 cytokine receptor-like factor 2 [Brienomyrus brachyistius]